MNLRRFGAWAGRSLSTRIVIVFLGLLVAIQAASFMAISLRMQRYTQGKLPATFAKGEGVLVHLLAQQGDELTKDASLLAADYGFRAAVQSNDAPTIASALANHGARIGATESALLDTDFSVLAFSDASEASDGNAAAAQELAGLIHDMALRAARDGRATTVALLRGRPHQLVLIPMKAPMLIGWVMMGFPIPESLAGNLKLLTSLDLTLVSHAPAAPGWSSLQSTLGGEGGRALAARFAGAAPATADGHGDAGTPGRTELELGDDRLGVRAVMLSHEAPARGRAELVALLSLSVAKAGRPPQEVHLALILATLLGVVLFGVGSVITARRVTTPLRALAAAAERLGDGDYNTPIAGQARDDEVGELAKSFERMRVSVVAKQQQLVQSEKLASIGQLAAGVAHEINNPMGFVSSNFTSLEDYLARLFKLLKAYQAEEHGVAGTPSAQRLKRAREDAEVDYLQEDIPALMAESREGIDRVLKIVQDLKDFSHMDMRRHWEFADLHAGLDSTLNIVSNEIKFRADVVKAYGELPEVECVPSELNQVFMNLLVNAAHAMGKERGTISLGSGASADEAWVTVTDNGSGIPADVKKRIFDPFFTTKPVGKGTGLGLSLSYGIVKKHGGRIEVDSEPGRGTTFRVVIPLRRALAA